MPKRSRTTLAALMLLLAPAAAHAGDDDGGLKNCVKSQSGASYLEKDKKIPDRWNSKTEDSKLTENRLCFLFGGLKLTAGAGETNTTRREHDRVDAGEKLRVRGSKDTVELKAGFENKAVLAEFLYSLDWYEYEDRKGWFAKHVLENVRLNASIGYETILDEEVVPGGDLKNRFDRKTTYDVSIKYVVDVNEFGAWWSAR